MSSIWNLKKEKVSIEVKYLPSIPVICHPLNINGKLHKSGSISTKKTPKSKFIDPLSIALDGADPLTAEYTKNDPLSHVKLQDKEDLSFAIENFKSWDEICSQYLAKCNTKQRLSLASNFPLNSELGGPNFESLGYNKVKGSTQTESERIRLRMEYLTAIEDSNSSRDLTSLTSDQFSEYISYLKSELLNVWKSEHRVKALKIAKESAKSLGLSTPELFYPYKFMLITDLMTTLGQLVYQRLSEIPKVQSVNNSMEVKEIARNWFSNISSIRDLLPRIYLEAALLQCYVFSDIDTIEGAFQRLLKMTRGLADPLVCSYAKMYVVKVGLGGNHSFHVAAAICDIKDVLQWGWSEQGIESIDVGNEPFTNGKEIAEKVFYPPLLWLLQCLVNRCSLNTNQTILEICSKTERLLQYLFVKATFATFPASFVANECISFNYLVSQCLQNGTNPHDLLIYYGKMMNLAPPSKEQKFGLISGIWNLLCTLDSLGTFIKACDPWMQFVVQNFEVNDVEKILSNLVKKITLLSEGAQQSYHSDMLHLVVNILKNAKQPELLLQKVRNLQQLLIMLQREVVGSRVVGKDGKTRLGLSELKELLETIISHHPSPLKEQTLIKILIELFSSLHDRINALTTGDEKRQVSYLLRDFILKVDFGKDFAQQLEFYVSCRASFVNLDSILEILIHQVCKHQMETLYIMRRKHSNKTASFERACTAYCFITIPSITSSIKRLKLYLLAGSVAMVNSCVSQAQTCIESAIQEVSKSTELLSTETVTNSDLLPALLCLCSYLIATPCLSSSSFQWFVSVTDAVRKISNNSELVNKINISILKAICASSNRFLPYHFSGVIGNDSVFSFERRQGEAIHLCNRQISNILSSVTLKNSETYSAMKAELLECLLQYGGTKDNTKIVVILKSLTKETDKVYYEKKIRRLMQL